VLDAALRESDSKVFAAHLSRVDSHEVTALRLGKKTEALYEQAVELARQLDRYSYGVGGRSGPGRWGGDRVRALCRARHDARYAELAVMPSGAGGGGFGWLDEGASMPGAAGRLGAQPCRCTPGPALLFRHTELWRLLRSVARNSGSSGRFDLV
jgi:hypothetical protein